MANYTEGLLANEVRIRYEKMPDFPIVTFENGGSYADEVVTYGDLFQNACKVAKTIIEAGIKRGERFSVVMRNHPEFLYILIAASMTGTVMVPIDPRSKGSKLTYQIKNSGSKGVFFSKDFTPEVQASLAEIPDVKVLGVVYKEGFANPRLPEYPSMDEIIKGPEVSLPCSMDIPLNAPFQVIYTSGTTGDPKGVVIKAQMPAMCKMAAQMVWQYTSDDKLYTGLSLTHGNAQSVTMSPALMLGIPAVISRKFSKSRLWDICRKFNCTTFSLLGGMMMGIYSEPRKPNDGDNPVHTVISAGTPRSIWEDFEKRFNVRIHEWYAAIEGGFAHNPPGVGPIGSFGKPLEGLMEIKIVREDDSECEPGEIGELVAIPKEGRAEVEYLGNKKASEAKTRGGVLRSGDMCHKDKDGWLYFDFRKGGGLRRQGDFIMPEYIEKALAEMQEISDSCVYGIPAASGAPGESDIVAAVVAAPGATIDPKGVLKKLNGTLEKAWIPSYLQIVDEIPKTASEKNLDRILRESFRLGASNVFAL